MMKTQSKTNIKKETNALSPSRDQIGSPGPAEYDQTQYKNVKEKYPEWGIPQAERDEHMNEVPGPGQYDPKKEQNAAKFSIGSKTVNDKMIKPDTQQIPGPGTYQQDSIAIQESTPQYTFGTKHQQQLSTDVPGPGQYSIQEQKTSTATNIKFNTSKRETYIDTQVQLNSDQPGPGSYSYQDGVGQKVSKRQMDTSSTVNIEYQTREISTVTKEQLNTPGPGMYDSQASASFQNGKSPMYGFGSSKRDGNLNNINNNAHDIPGPGQYNVEQEHEGGFTIGKKFQQQTSENPGPGQYDTSSNVTKGQNQAYKMGQSKRTDLNSNRSQSDQPGPGNYNSQQNLGKGGPSYQMGIKTKDTAQNDNPGPGSYRQNESIDQMKGQSSHKFSESKRSQLNGNGGANMPGPGNYNTSLDTVGEGKAYKFQGKRNEKVNDNPGPGQYTQIDQKTTKASSSYKFSESQRTSVNGKGGKDMPGPGNYNNSLDTVGEGKAYKFQGKRNEKMNDNPGPGQYTQRDNVTRTQSQTLKIGTSKRSEIISKEALYSPGPGAYVGSPDNFGKQGFSMQSKRNQKQNDGPGPGAYTQRDGIACNNQGSLKIGNEKRNTFVSQVNEENPGPGNYNSASSLGGRAFKFQGKRYDKNSEVPGPGSYTQKDELTRAKQVSLKMGTSKRQTFASETRGQNPGPGNYNQQSTLGSGKAFAFQGKKQEKYSENPGPGSYNSQNQLTKINSQSLKMGSSKRTTFVQEVQEGNPGPGNYNSNSNLGKGGFAFQGKQNQKQNENPGPGSYNSRNEVTKYASQSMRMSSAKRQTFMSDVREFQPGPGNYNSGSEFGQGKGHKFEGKHKQNYSEVPGPGSYSQRDDFIRSSQKSVKMSNAKRTTFMEEIQEVNPGPGNYSFDQTSGKGGFKFGGKYKEKYSEVPGPGSYTQRDDLKRASSQSMRLSSAKRTTFMEDVNQSQPGPGNYNHSSAIGQGKAFKFEGKYKQQYNQNPGPGSYTQRDEITKNTSKSMKMSSAKRQTFMEDIYEDQPGPGNYNHSSAIGQGKAFKFEGKYKQQYNENPGPGSYSQRNEIIKSNSQSMRVSSAKRTTFMGEIREGNPGPGNYSSEQTFGNGKAFKFEGKYQQKYNENPGPGSYSQRNEVIKSSSQSMRVSSAKRTTFMGEIREGNPGPGNYNSEQTFGNGKAFKFEGKYKQQYNENPGPGSYSQRNEVIKSSSQSMRVSSAKRTTFMGEIREGNPGPGNYSSEQTFGNGKAFKFEGKYQHKYNENPGPGSYSQRDELIKSSSKSMRLASAKRTTFMEDIYEDQPGPGNYNAQSTFGQGKAFKFEGKRQQKYNENPGPGSYSQQDQLIKSTSKSMRMSSSKRTTFMEEISQQNPGPGNYNQETQFGQGKSHKFGGKYQHKYSEVPGPGSYTQRDEITKTTSKSMRISNAKRITFMGEILEEVNPGPGNYYSDSQFGNGKSFKFEGKYKESYNQNPGPGAYAQNNEITKINSKSQRIATSKRTTFMSEIQEVNPGPGNYNSDSQFGNGKAFKFEGKRQVKYSEVPGPGSYSNGYEMTRMRSQSVSMGINKRKTFMSEVEEVNPGPGNYNQTTSFGNGKAFKFEGKRQQKYSDVPGPGSYTQKDEITRMTSKSQKIGTSQRKTFVSRSLSFDELPGPCNYQQTSTFGEGKSYKFQGKYETKYNDVPGPGSYSQRDELIRSTQQSQRMSSAKRTTFMNEIIEEIPGPGNYNQQSSFAGKAFTFEGKRDQKYSDVPGPGSYSQRDELIKSSSKSHRMSSAKRTTFMSEVVEEMPGPGNYNQESNIAQGKAYTFEGKRQQKYSEVPGPGSYNSNEEFVKNSSHSLKIGNAKRTTFAQESISEMPGPGNYDQQSTIGQGKAYKFEGKREEKYNDVPGPGSYSQTDELVKSSSKSHRMSSAKRTTFMNEVVEEIPGPGNYQQESSFAQGKGFSFEGKREEKYNDVPGPGSYSQNNEFIKNSSQSQVMSNAKRTTFIQEVQEDMPGPGNYNQTSTFGQGKAFTFEGKKETKYSDVPGPGSYSQNDEIIRNHQTQQKMSSAKRTTFAQEIQEEIPGPGNYNQESTFGKGKGALIEGRREEKYSDVPGPGSYNQTDEITRTSHQSVKIGGQKRTTSIVQEGSEDIPGPGNYNQTSTIGQGKAFTFQGKKEEQYSDVPGPGSYNQTDEITRTSHQSVKIGGSKRITSIVEEGSEDIPGPGNYDHTSSIGQGKAFTFEGKKETKYNDVPGPGSYNQSDELTKSGQKSMRMGSAQRVTSVVQESSQDIPGPGNYNQESTFGKGKAAIIEGKREQKYSDVPGPGTYNTTDEKIKMTQQTAFIGSEKRLTSIVEEGSQEMPGPGNYSQASQFGQGKGYSIQGKKDNQINDNPGPGHYNQTDQITKTSQQSVIIGTSQRQTSVIQENSLDMPGPGNYSQPSQFGQAKGYSFSGKKGEAVNDMPGPGHYNQNDHITKTSQQQVIIGHQERTTHIIQSDSQSIPGPGNYSQPSQFDQNKGFTMQGKKEQPITETPGPAHYNVNDNSIKTGQQTATMGNSQRQTSVAQDENSDMPGPGNYSQSSQFGTGQGYTFGGKQQQQQHENQNHEVVASGSSHQQNEITNNASQSHNTGNAKKSTAVIQETSSENAGAHRNNNQASSLGQIKGSQNISQQQNNNASANGVGAGSSGSYNLQEKNDKGGSSSGQISGGKKVTTTAGAVNQQILGGGLAGSMQHDQTLGNNGGYTIQGKGQQQQVESTPGPGAYNQNDEAIRTGGGQAVKFGNAQRSSATISGNGQSETQSMAVGSVGQGGAQTISGGPVGSGGVYGISGGSATGSRGQGQYELSSASANGQGNSMAMGSSANAQQITNSGSATINMSNAQLTSGSHSIGGVASIQGASLIQDSSSAASASGGVNIGSSNASMGRREKSGNAGLSSGNQGHNQASVQSQQIEETVTIMQDGGGQQEVAGSSSSNQGMSLGLSLSVATAFKRKINQGNLQGNGSSSIIVQQVNESDSQMMSGGGGAQRMTKTIISGGGGGSSTSQVQYNSIQQVMTTSDSTNYIGGSQEMSMGMIQSNSSMKKITTQQTEQTTHQYSSTQGKGLSLGQSSSSQNKGLQLGLMTGIQKRIQVTKTTTSYSTQQRSGSDRYQTITQTGENQEINQNMQISGSQNEEGHEVTKNSTIKQGGSKGYKSTYKTGSGQYQQQTNQSKTSKPYIPGQTRSQYAGSQYSQHSQKQSRQESNYSGQDSQDGLSGQGSRQSIGTPRSGSQSNLQQIATGQNQSNFTYNTGNQGKGLSKFANTKGKTGTSQQKSATATSGGVKTMIAGSQQMQQNAVLDQDLVIDVNTDVNIMANESTTSIQDGQLNQQVSSTKIMTTATNKKASTIGAQQYSSGLRTSSKQSQQSAKGSTTNIKQTKSNLYLD